MDARLVCSRSRGESCSATLQNLIGCAAERVTASRHAAPSCLSVETQAQRIRPTTRHASGEAPSPHQVPEYLLETLDPPPEARGRGCPGRDPCRGGPSARLRRDLMIQRDLSEVDDHGVPSRIGEASTREELPIQPARRPCPPFS